MASTDNQADSNRMTGAEIVLRALKDNKPVIPLDAHIRLASPETNGGERMLRRGYSYTDGIDADTGLLDAGLFFIAFQKDPRKQFVPIQRKLAHQRAQRPGIVVIKVRQAQLCLLVCNAGEIILWRLGHWFCSFAS